ncbi:MAG: ABC transporter substrate-binding protein [Propionibacteriaceae bacterium]|jgi:putative ABC transport system substrate-binding protein|nr:ABC transporter substrate-binding protein [Propionibacteriaceae bacterium]
MNITMAKAGATSLVLASIVALSACGGPQTSANPSTSISAALRVGVAQIISHPSLDAIRNGFENCLADLGHTDVVYDEQNPQGDQAALTSIANNFTSSDLDLVVAITTPVAQAMAQAITDRPIVFAGVTDPVAAGLVDSFAKPGSNLTGTSDYPPIDAQMQLIRDIKPEVKAIGVVYSSSEVNAEVQLDLAKQAAAKLGLEVKAAAVTNGSEVQQAAASLAGVDAFYVGNDNAVVAAIEGLVQAAEQQKVPVITADPDSVGRGATASYAVNQTQMGCQAAKMADAILKGADPVDLAVVKMADLADALVLTINPSAASRQGVTIPESVSSRAGVEVVGD